MTTSADVLGLSIPEAANKVNAAERVNGVQVSVTLPANAAENDTITFALTGPDNSVQYIVYNIAANDLTASTAVVTIPAIFCAADGAYSFNAVLTDANGVETTPAQASFEVDRTAPAKPAVPTGYSDDAGSIQNDLSTATSTDDAKPGVQIGKNLVDTPKLYVDGKLVSASYDAVKGTLTPTTALADGKHTFAVSLTDSAGNESVKSGALNITIDTTAPTTPVAAPASYADDVGAIQNVASTAATTDDTKPGIQVGAGLTDTPKLYVDGVAVAATYDAVAGTLTPVNALSEGSHEVSYTLTDAAGNESGRSPAISVTIDTTAPDTPTLAPTGYKDDVGTIQNTSSTAPTTDDNKPGIKVGSNLSDTPKLYVDGAKVDATYDPVTGTLTPVNALGDGPHQITYSLTDAAGNESGRSPALSVTIDTTPPDTPVGAPANYADDMGSIQSATSTAASTDDNKPGINVGTGLGGTPKLYVDGSAVAATYDAVKGTLTPVTALGDGAHAFTYTLSDAAGNESGQSPALNITIDTTAPTFTSSNAATATDENVPVNTVVYTAKSTDVSAVTYTLKAGVGDAANFTIDSQTGVVALLESPDYETKNSYTFTVIATDAAGNKTEKSVNLAINNVNEAAVITGDLSKSLTEGDTAAAISTTGQLTVTDVDSSTTCVVQTNVIGTGGYGKFSINAAGAWSYVADSAHNEFVAGKTYTDSFTVTTADGTTATVSVNILGTNDAAVIGGTSAVTLTETNVAQTATGTLTITDVDSAATFVAQTAVAGNNGYGKFSVTTAGVWTYTMDNAHDEFVAGKAYTDSLTVVSADGTTKVVTVTINGTDDAAYIGGTSTASLTETDAVQTATGTLAVLDVDSAVNNTFVAQTNVAKTYGSFTVTTGGVWTYTMSSAHNEFVAGQTYTDSITVTSATGLTKVVTVSMLGTNDAAVIGGTSAVTLTETNVAQTATGTLTITDVDSAATFVAQTAVAGSNGYGKFSVTTAGVWTYTMDNAHDEFVAGKVYTDSLTVASADGITKVVTVSITGTNDAPTLSFVDTGASNADAITNSATMNVSSLEASATWEYQVDGGVWKAGTGTAFNMSEGQHTYNVRQKDSLNNVSAITSKTVTLDTIAPNAAGIALASDAGVSNSDGVTNNGTVNVSLSSDTNNWQYSTNGGSTWTNGTGTAFALSAGTYAANNVKVQAFDKAGNATVSSYASATVVDTSAPTVSVSIDNTGLNFGQSTTVHFNFSEAVYGFANNDVSVSGGSLSNITGSGNSYSATFTAGYSYNGGSYVSVGASSYTDLAGNNGGSGSTGSFRVGPNVANIASGMSLYVTGYGHGWADTQGWISIALGGNNDLQGATVTLYDGWGHSWSNSVAGSGGSTYFGTFSGGGNDLTQFHADISYAGQTASVGGGVAYQVTWRGLLGWGLFNCIKQDTAYSFCYTSPIVLDLNGDGIQTVATEQGVQFDIAADGAKQSIGWVDKHDALLVRDINHDGQINNGTELFGSNTVLKNGERAGDGWAAMAEMDANGDGKVDAKDANFAELKVWVDANGDGVTDAGELRGLLDAGIQSIDVSHVNSNNTQNGNVLSGTGQFTKTDGTTAAVSDAWFQVAQMVSLDFTQVKDQPIDLTDDKAQTVKINLQDLLTHSQTYGALQISGDTADAVQIVNGGTAVTSQTQMVNGQAFSAYDLNHDGVNDLLIQQTMHQAQFA